MRIYSYIFSLLVLFTVDFAFGQQRSEKEILDLIKKTIDSKEKIELYIEFSNLIFRKDTVTAKKYADQALLWADSINFEKGKLESLNQLARLYIENGKLTESLLTLEAAIEYGKNLKEYYSIGNIYLTKGNLHDIKGEISEALNCYFEGEKFYKKANSKKGTGLANMGIGNIYFSTANYEEAVVKYRKSYNDLNEIGNTYAQWSLHNMAAVFVHLNKLDSAKYFYNISLIEKEKAGDLYGASYTYIEIGNLYKKEGNYKTALDYYKKSLSLKQQLPGISKESLGKAFMQMGETYFLMKENSLALDYLNQALENISESEAYDALMAVHKLLSVVNKDLKKFPTAISHLEQYAILLDSISQIKSSEKLAEMITKYQTSEKEHQLVLVNKENEMNKLRAEKAGQEAKKKNILLGTSGAILILLLFSVLIAIRNINIRKRNNLLLQKKNEEVSQQKEKVEKQKELLEEKNKEVLDSITYAKRLQQAILPPHKLIKEWMPDSFVLYRPKDIVAGDFYWMESYNNKIYFAAADCTGHGVPGAMVSVICSNALNKALLEENISNPGKILDRVADLVIHLFKKSEDEVKDGMDIALVVMDIDNSIIEYAGANNPLWIIRNGRDSSEKKQLEEYKPTKQPVGNFDNRIAFESHSIKINKGDNFYIFSDGYTDQFGGEKGKKFKTANFKKLLLSIQDLEMEKQKDLLSETFDNWKGKLEQVDDVTVVGISV